MSVSSDVDSVSDSPFEVHLQNFSGPFDLLLQLIARHQLDVTEVALSRVTDEFIAYIKAGGRDWDLDETSQFLVVAATLLDLKAARLLPARARSRTPRTSPCSRPATCSSPDCSSTGPTSRWRTSSARTLAEEERRLARDVDLEPRFTRLLPEVVLDVSPERFAALAAKALTPAPADVISLAHLHAPAVSVRDQAGVVVDRLRRTRTLTFRALTADSPDRVTTVARFLALLELFREGAVAFEQLTPLGELTVRWTGAEAGELEITDEYDEQSGQPAADGRTR